MKIAKKDIQDLFPLTPLQKGMFFYSQLEESSAYLEQFVYEMTGELEVDLLEKAFNILVDRYDVLRACFIHKTAKQPLQVILKERRLTVHYEDLSQRTDVETYLEAFKAKDKQNNFSLDQDLLMRVYVFKKAPQEFVIIWTYHHIIMDGWSYSVLAASFFDIYRQLVKKEKVQKPFIPPFRDYLAWLQEQDETLSQIFWKNQLIGFEKLTSIDTAHRQTKGKGYLGKNHFFTLSKATTNALQQLSEHERVTMNSLVQSLWGLLLGKYNGCRDVVFGSVISGRPSELSGIEQMVGLFINTIPVRIQFDSDTSFIQLIKDTQTQALEAESHHYLSLAVIQSLSELKHQLLDHLLVFENFPKEEELKQANHQKTEEQDLDIAEVEVYEQTNYDFNIQVVLGDQLTFKFSYNSILYQEQQIQRIASQLECLVEQVVKTPSILAKDLTLLHPSEAQQQIAAFNPAPVAFPAQSSIVQLFRAQASSRPNAPAVFFDGATLTYQQLEENSNRITLWLKEELKIEKGDFVALLVERELDLLSLILGTLKVGAAYVPIEPKFSTEYIQHILKQTSAKVLICNDATIIDNKKATNFQIVKSTAWKTFEPKGTVVDPIIGGDDVAYAMYTSGSTGKPKGVLISHRNVVSLVKSVDYVPLNEDTRILQSGAIAFDASTFEIWGTLLNGGQLFLFKQNELLDASFLKEAILKQKINTVFLTSSWFNQLVDIDVDVLAPVQYLLTGGEAMSTKHINVVKTKLPEINVKNIYGPTENTTFSLAYPISELQESSVPIGYPLANCRAYVMDVDGHLLPAGVIGELYLGGEGVALGYLGLEKETAAKFIDLEIGELRDRVYRTGDMVQWTEDGAILFKGRKDKQIKLHGYRIELEAISRTINKHPQILRSEVLLMGDQLRCFYVSEKNEELDLTKAFEQQLPAYQLPKDFIRLDEFPLMTSGKLDHKLLRKKYAVLINQQDYTKPRNELDEQLLKIWNGLLEVDKIGIRDNFFEIGGHSLTAMRMVAEIQKQLDKRISLKDLFVYPTIEQLSDHLLVEENTGLSAISLLPIQEDYALSHGQKRLWVMSKIEQSAQAFNFQIAYQLGGDFRADLMQKAWANLIQRHEVLRTIFLEKGEEVRQQILPFEEATFGLKIKKLGKNENLETALETLTNTVFDLSEAPLFRAILFKEENENVVFGLVMHHIITDGWSMDILYRELIQLYESYLAENIATLPVLNIQYKDYAAWQRKALMSGGTLAKQKDYWMTQFSGEIPVLDLPLDYRRPLNKTYNGRQHNLLVGNNLAEKLSQFSTQLNVSPFSVMLSSIYVLLFRYCHQEDIVIGMPVAGREHPDLVNQLGFYVSMLPIRIQKAGTLSFSELVKEVHQQLLESYAHQSYPFDLLVEELDLQRDTSRSPLYDVGITWQSSINKEEATETSFDVESEALENRTARRDLWFYGSQIGEALFLAIEFNTDLFNQQTIQRMGSHLLSLVEDGIQHPEKTIEALEFLTQMERVQLLENYAGTSRPVTNKSIPVLFSEIARQHPELDALVLGDRRITYRELDLRSSQLADYLQTHHQLKREDRVGILMGRNEWHIISLLAILKVGAAYVPIEPKNPAGRIKYLLEDSDCKVLVTESDRMFEVMDFYKGALFAPDVELDDSWKGMEAKTWEGSAIDDLAYIIYTSGSTGRPKGVMVQQSAMLRLVFDQQYYPFGVGNRLIQTGSLAFDASTFEIWGSLLHGGELHLLSEAALLDINLLKAYMQEEKIQGMFITTAWFNQIVETDITTFGSLNVLLTGGEAMSIKHINQLTSRFPDLKVSNIYGPTENTTYSLYHPIVKPYKEDVPVGKPIENTQAYVVDERLRLVPQGVYGELLLGGKGLAIGYVNNEEETTKRFIPNPFKTDDRLYRTGDIVRWEEGGVIGFRGRRDTQIKLRGFRIELEEISHQLENHTQVKSAFVMIHQSTEGNRRLVAYYTGEELGEEAVRKFMSEELPAYSLPHDYVYLKQFPLNVNGKVDKKQLPLPNEGSPIEDFLPPSTEVEITLSEIWAKLLQKNKIGLNDNFFVIGGDSIKAIRLISEVNSIFDCNLQVKDVFQLQELKELAQFITENGPTKKARVKALNAAKVYLETWQEKQLPIVEEELPQDGPIDAVFPMSDIEKGMIYHNLLAPDSGVYHDQVYTQLEGEEYVPELLKKAYALLIKKHEMFRVAFHMYGFEEPTQIVYSYKEELVDFDFVDLSDKTSEEQRAYLQQFMIEDRQLGFEITKPGLCRFRLFKLADKEFGICWIFHHAILDGWSNASFLTELSLAYKGLQDDPTHELTPLKASYKDYILDQIQIKQNEDYTTFWKKELAEYERTPLMLYPKAVESNVVKAWSKGLDVDFVKQLNAFTKDYKIDIKTLLLSGFVYLMKMTTNRSDILFGMVSNGRPEVLDGDKIFGCFLNTIPVRVQLKPDLKASDLMDLVIEKVKTTKAYDKLSLHQIVTITGEEAKEQNPYFDIMFNYLDFHILEESDDSSDFSERLVDDHTVANTVFDFTVQKTEGTIFLTLNYLEGQYQVEDLDRLVEYYKSILEQMISNPESILSSDSILPQEEKILSLQQFNATERAYPKEQSVHELFELQVQKTPNAVALIDHDLVLTYQELNEQANQWSHYLLENYDLTPESTVALLADRTHLQIIALLAILKAGAVYVPIDPQHPKNRVQYVLEELNPTVVLVEKEQDVSRHNLTSRNFLQLGEIAQKSTSFAKENPNVAVSADQLIYIIYTSGSTGMPKGVMVEHRSVVRLAINNPYVLFNSDTRLLPTCALSFDVSTFEIWSTLLNGGQLILLTQEEMLDANTLKAFAQKHQVNTMWMTGGLCNRFVNEDVQLFASLTTLIAGGEVLSPPHMQKLQDQYPTLQLVNGYGPTENTTFSTAHQIKTIHPDGIPIGQPIANSQVFILDDTLQPVPIGVWGELYLAGDGLARGYWGKEELNRESFVYSNVLPNVRLYKSGDYGRWNKEGIIEFKGRLDFQVKLRGYRIELSEISFHLQEYAGIESAEVLVHEDQNGAAQLIAYYTGTEISTSDLSAYLYENLPFYMVPAVYIPLAEFPLSVSGKIDRSRLPEPNVDTSNLEQEYVAPQTAVESQLQQIWQKLLASEQIGTNDNFFEKGGNSIRAVQLNVAIYKELQAKVALRDIFLHPTIHSLAKYIETLDREGFQAIEVISGGPLYELSHAQYRLWAIHALRNVGVSYHLPLTIEFAGAINSTTLKEAWKQLLNRHESLRTTFIEIGGLPYQLVHDLEDVVIDFETIKIENNQELISKQLGEFDERAYDLEKGPLCRILLLELEKEEYIIALNLHHIISDGWSMGILQRDLLELYESIEEERAERLKPLRIQYKDFASWQKEQIQEAADIENSRSFWMKQFADGVPVLELPIDKARPNIRTFNGNSITIELSTELHQSYHAFFKSNNVSPFAGWLAAYSALVQRVSNQRDMVIGFPVSGRVHPDLEEQIGFYVNLIPFRIQLDHEVGFEHLTQQIYEQVLQVFEHQNYPFDLLVEELVGTKDASRSPLFDIGFNWVSETTDTGKRNDSLSNNYNSARSDIWLHVVEDAEGLRFVFEYNTDLFEASSMHRIVAHFESLLEGMLNAPATDITKHSLIKQVERQRMLVDFNQTEMPYPKDKAFPELFLQQTNQQLNALAIVEESGTMTYQELHERSNRLAHYLRKEYAIQPEDRIGIHLERSADLVVAVLAVLKAGGAYVPLDTTYPQERNAFIVKDASLVAIISHSNFADVAFKANTILIDKNTAWQKASKENLPVFNQADDLAYVIYTSGSTGVPKGVMVEHRALINLCYWHHQTFETSHESRATLYASTGFDASVWEIFPNLLAGARLYPLSEANKLEVDWILDYFEQHAISHTFLPTAIYERIQEHFKSPRFANLKILTGGDQLHRIAELQAQLFNNYGLTETTVVATSIALSNRTEEESNIPIGAPISNTQIYIVDDSDQLVPIGMSGEICISGDSLARGYLNRPEESKRFAPNPFKEGTRWYKTGDLGKWRADGQIMFLGRKDFQVQIRGHRVEPMEVESILNAFNGLDEVKVLALFSNNTKEHQLVAYYTSEEETPIKTRVLRQYLQDKIPTYMIPSQFIAVDVFPLTANGKIDVEALKQMAEGIRTITVIPASTPMEHLLIEVWEKVLAISPIGIKNNFFELGGDSIKAIQISAGLNDHGFGIKVRDIFNFPTIQQLAVVVKKVTRIPDQTEITGRLPLNAVQKRFFELNVQQHHYNQTFLFDAKQEMNAELLHAVFNKIVEHHDALRMQFVEENGEIIQYNRTLAESEISLEIVDLQEESDEGPKIEAHSNQVQSSFDLASDSLVKLVLFKRKTGDSLLIVIHHLVIDTVSWRILFQDLETLMEQYRGGQTLKLPLKTDSFKKWSEELLAYAQSEQFIQQEASYWKKIITTPIETLPVENKNVDNLQGATHNYSLRLPSDLTKSLLTTAHRSYNTEINDLLLAALAMAIKQTFGLKDIKLDLEGHGRESFDENLDVNRTIGWFTTIFPVLLEVEENRDLSLFIRQIKEQLRSIPSRGFGYGLLKYMNKSLLENEPKENRSEISFNYLGQFDSDLNEEVMDVADISTGDTISPKEVRPYLLDVMGMVSNQQLTMTFVYHPDHFTGEVMTQLSAAFSTSIEELVEHCLERETPLLTPADLNYNDLTIEQVETLAGQYDIEDIYPLSPMQENLHFLSELLPDSSAYLEQFTFQLAGTLDRAAFSKALNGLCQRHVILRSCYLARGYKTPIQLIAKTCEVPVQFEDLSALSDSEKATQIDLYKEKDLEQAFDLSEVPLMRAMLLKQSETAYTFIWSYHHILFDGWCLSPLMKELFELYERYSTASAVTLPAPENYTNYLSWLGKQDRARTLERWSDYLNGYEATASFYQGMPTIEESGNYAYRDHSFALSVEATQALRNLAINHQVTLNIVLQALWGILLAKYNQVTDVAFGAIVSGRPAQVPGIERMIGLFINTIPVRISFEQETAFSTLIKSLQKEALELEAHHYVSLATIQAQTELRSHLVDHIIAFENFPIDQELKTIGEDKESEALRAEELVIDDVEIHEQTNYDFNLQIGLAEQLTFKMSYNANRYSAEHIEAIENRLKLLTDQIIAGPNQAIDALDLLNAEERDQLLKGYEKSLTSYPAEQSIIDVFRTQVALQPEAIALKVNEAEMTYQTLEDKSNQFSAWLKNVQGVQSGDYVALVMERGMELMISILGILKAGAAYVPISVEHPDAHIQYILEQSKPSLLIYDSEGFSGRFQDNLVPMVEWTEWSSSKIADATDTISLARPDDVAYVIFTSGSTGHPKGVMVPHRGVVNMSLHQVDKMSIQASDGVLQFASATFDASVYEMFMALFSGASLVIVPPAVIMKVDAFVTYIERLKVSVVTLPPSYLSLIDVEQLQFLRVVITAGEPPVVKQALQLAQFCDYYNAYGPTEASVCIASYKIEKTAETLQQIPIGQPVANLEILLLDDSMNLVPYGMRGQICVAGPGLALGYINQEALTENHFVDHPYRAGERLYETGDLGRWLPDGNLLFEGRADSQVKINGHRVELSAIARMMEKHASVKQAEVFIQNNRLLAFYVSEEQQELDVLTYLADRLPSYMVPKNYWCIDHFPLTINGKIDKKELFKVVDENQDLVEAYLAPKNQLETRLVAVWEEVLDKKPIGVNDNFFEIGGDSLKAIQLVSKLQLNYSILVNDIFKYPNIALLAKHISYQKDYLFEKLNRVKYDLGVPMSADEQERLQQDINERKEVYNEKLETYRTLDISLEKAYQNIFLTGATGFLGCHLLRQLLQHTDLSIHVLIRGLSKEEALERLNKKYQFYFKSDLPSQRIAVYCGDLSQDRMGLEEDQYAELSEQIDVILNAAANVKHYGQMEDFTKVNLIGTENLIDFAQVGLTKDIHHISTINVAIGHIKEKDMQFFSEFDCDLNQDVSNVYAKTKLDAEKLLLAARDTGVNCSIYRVGNLVSDSQTGIFQENISGSSFLNRIKSFVEIGYFVDYENNLEFSAVDRVSEAIRLLFNRESLLNETHHLQNNQLLSLKDFTAYLNEMDYNLAILETNDFINFALSYYDDYQVQFNDIFLRYGVLNDEDEEETDFFVTSDKSNLLLERLDFEWQKPDAETIKKLIKHTQEVKFLPLPKQLGTKKDIDIDRNTAIPELSITPSKILTEMPYRQLGDSDLKISALGLGTWLTFGNQITNQTALQLMATAYENGVNYFDNAEVYANGRSEIIMGNIFKKMKWNRDTYLVSSKVFVGELLDENNNVKTYGLDSKHIRIACEKSLLRMQLDYLDIYLCHRADENTPMEVVVETMTQLVQQGKIRHWGTSEWSTSQVEEACKIAQQENWIKPVVEQPQYNMLHRTKVEAEFEPLYEKYGIGLTTFAPLYSGVLTGKYNKGIPKQSRLNLKESQPIKQQILSQEESGELKKVAQLMIIAKELGMSMAQLALAWCLKNSNVNSVLLGASKLYQMEENLAAIQYLDLLSPEVLLAIDEILENKPSKMNFNG